MTTRTLLRLVARSSTRMRARIDLPADDTKRGETQLGGRGKHHDRPPVWNRPHVAHPLDKLELRDHEQAVILADEAGLVVSDFNRRRGRP
jgi:hypothetical protein